MTLRLNGSTSGYTEIDAPAIAGSNTLVLPGGNGSAGQVLTTNGSGTLSWGNVVQAATNTHVIWVAPNGTKVMQAFGRATTTSATYVDITFPFTFTSEPVLTLAPAAPAFDAYNIICRGYNLSTSSARIWAIGRGPESGATAAVVAHTIAWTAIGTIA